MDGTIKFWDPTAREYLLQSSNYPTNRIKPGYYIQGEEEQTYDNMPFNEVEKIYTGKAKCYKIKPFYTSIPASRLYGTDSKNLYRKRQPLENFYCLYLDKA
jgi:hypothetical protein